MKILFHHSDRAKHGTVLGNVRNLLDDETVDLDAVAVVANAEGVEILRADGDHDEAVRSLLDRGVSFAACGNTLEGSDLDRADLLDGIEVVPSGVGELARLQDRGYGYVRP